TEATLRDLTQQMITRQASPGEALHSMTSIPETAFHDFAEYRFIRDPDLFSAPIVNGPPAAVRDLLAAALNALIKYIDALPRTTVILGTAIDALIIRMYKAFKIYAVDPLYEFISVIVPGYTGMGLCVLDDVLAIFMTCLAEQLPKSID